MSFSTSYGEGFGFALKSSFQAVGQDLILMFGGQTSAQAGGQRSGRDIRLDLTDVDLIRDNVPLVSAVSAETMIRGAAVLRGTRQQNMSIRGVEPAYGKVRNMTLAEGRWINGEDYLNKQRVAILGDKAAHKLFGEIPPVGETIAINGIQFQIIGLLKTKTQISNYNTPDNECVFIPLSTASLLHDIKHPEDIVWIARQSRLSERSGEERARRSCARARLSSRTTSRLFRFSCLTNLRKSSTRCRSRSRFCWA